MNLDVNSTWVGGSSGLFDGKLEVNIPAMAPPNVRALRLAKVRETEELLHTGDEEDVCRRGRARGSTWTRPRRISATNERLRNVAEDEGNVETSTGVGGSNACESSANAEAKEVEAEGTGEDPFAKLPAECLELVASSMSLRDASKAACSCRTWSHYLQRKKVKTRVLVVPSGIKLRGLISLVESYPELQELSLKKCVQSAQLDHGDAMTRVIGSLVGIPIQKLAIPGCSLESMDMGTMLALLPSLSHLDLSGCPGLNDAILFYMARKRIPGEPPHITSLVLNRCPDISSSGIRALFQGPSLSASLETLDISHSPCDNNTFRLSRCLKLATIHAVGMRNVTELNLRLPGSHALEDLNFANGSLERCTLELPNLKKVSLAKNTKLWFLSLSCPELETVSLSGCSKLEFLGWDQRLGYMGRKVKHLNVNGCRSLSSGQIEEVLPNLKELETLDVDGCRGITGLTSFSPFLTKVNANGCPYLTKVEIGSNSFHTLHASGCANLATVIVSSAALQVLDLTNCSRLGNLEAGDLRKIPHLGLAGCTSLPQQG